MRTRQPLRSLAVCFLMLLSTRHACSQDMLYTSGPGPSSINAAGLPPGGGFPGYPYISPYDNAFSQTYNDGGMWFNRSVPGIGMGQSGRRYFTNLDVIRTRVRELDGFVGNKNAQSYYEQVFAVIPNTPPTDFGFFNYFDGVGAGKIQDLRNTGISLSGGFWNPDLSGLVWNVSWAAPNSSRYDARRKAERARYDSEVVRNLNRVTPVTTNNQRPFRPNRNEHDILEFVLTNDPDFLNTDIAPLDLVNLGTPYRTTDSGFLQQNLYNLNGIALDNGSFAGITVPYDIDFVLEHRLEQFGANIGIAMAPMIHRDFFTLRTVVGGRYMYIGEDFIFRGTDSGMLYDPNEDNVVVPDLKAHAFPNEIDENGDLIVDNAGAPETGGANNTVLNAEWNLISVQGLVRSSLVNEVTTQLAGPEIALRYDLGDPYGGGFTLFGQTKVGFMINRERIEMKGDNIGSITAHDPTTFTATTGGVRTELFDPTPDNPNPNRFSDNKSATHASPLFEQTFQAEFPIFQYVPVLSRMRALEGAKFRMGYSWLWIGNVASPNQSILWQGNPQAGLFPEINLKRDSYSIGSTNFGVSWEF